MSSADAPDEAPRLVDGRRTTQVSRAKGEGDATVAGGDDVEDLDAGTDDVKADAVDCVSPEAISGQGWNASPAAPILSHGRHSDRSETPAGWLEALAESEAELAAGQTVPGEAIRQRLRDAIARLEANQTAPARRGTITRR